MLDVLHMSLSLSGFYMMIGLIGGGYLGGRIMMWQGSRKVIDILVDCPSAIDEIPPIINNEGYKNEISQISNVEWRIRVEK
jgi:hypothetical protein